ncbi:hypothetical protein [Salmonirosea aquatica]|uniref:DUF4861 domain-containing protein n=1 Tax=Salmonirosea aquatica TaxID=2654236 RepID=A0A7C9FQU4_9BACT|nr:hypothetical protein [Cytophagaceae bacterium SJW1-29]
MKNFPAFLFGLLVLMALGMSSCQETYPPLAETEETTVPYALVSVLQPGSATEATVEVKIPQTETEDFRVDLRDKSGHSLPLQTGSNVGVANFKLRTYSASQLVAGEPYTVQLTYRDTRNNEITVNRAFTARSSGSWTKLPHAPIFGGDYTGAALLSPFFQSRIAVYRYATESNWNLLRYSQGWESTVATNPLPRHGAITFQLAYFGTNEQIFTGFGYITNEKIPGKKAYLPDLWSVGNFFSLGGNTTQVFHGFGAVDATVKFFTTIDEVFIIKEHDLGTMYSMNFRWEEKPVRPFPEKTGSLTAFTLDEVGYVLNQVPGTAPHLYAYYPQRDQWERKADLPGGERTEAASFSAHGRGYAGLGLSAEGTGLRDLWEYDPGLNTWRYHSEYPGQGHQLLIALSDQEEAYLGWGYESRTVEGSQARQQVGCTDFWKFVP